MNKIKLSRPLMLALAGLGIVGTGALTMSQVSAQTTTQSAAGMTNSVDRSQGGHVGTNGVKEELLTGDNASKATSAALAAVPGATVDRVETDAEGAAYEAHMTKSDGTHVTVKFDSSFNVATTETDQGPPMRQGN